MPSGKYLASSSSLLTTSSAVARPLAPGARVMPMPEEGWPLKRDSMPSISVPTATRATSRMWTRSPLSVTLRRTFSKPSVPVSRLCALMMTFRTWSFLPPIRFAPSWPAVTSAFWAVMAARTSEGVRLYLASLSASIQMRMTYLPPKTLTVPTPSVRLISSLMLVEM